MIIIFLTRNNNGYLQTLCIGFIKKEGKFNCLHSGFALID